MPDRTCLLCPVYRPDADPRPAWPACDGDLHRLDWHLADLPDLHHRLAHPQNEPYDDRWYAVVDEQGRLTGERRRADPLGAIGGAGPIPGRSKAPSVSGTRERSTPARLDRLDLIAPARAGTVRDTLVPAVVLRPVPVVTRRTVMGCGGPEVRQDVVIRLQRTPLLDEQGRPVMVGAGDQVGSVSVATVLDQWVRNWRDVVWPGERLPARTVAALAGWLRNAVAVAADLFEPLPVFAREVRALVGGLRGALGESAPRPAVMLGVPCRRCDVRSQIVLYPDHGYRECTGRFGCGLLYSESEWREWLADERVQRLLPGARVGGAKPVGTGGAEVDEQAGPGRDPEDHP